MAEDGESVVRHLRDAKHSYKCGAACRLTKVGDADAGCNRWNSTSTLSSVTKPQIMRKVADQQRLARGVDCGLVLLWFLPQDPAEALGQVLGTRNLSLGNIADFARHQAADNSAHVRDELRA